MENIYFRCFILPHYAFSNEIQISTIYSKCQPINLQNLYIRYNNLLLSHILLIFKVEMEHKVHTVKKYEKN